MTQYWSKLLFPLGIILLAVVIASIVIATELTQSSSKILGDMNNQLVTCRAMLVAQNIQPFLVSNNFSLVQNLLEQTIKTTNVTTILLLNMEGNTLHLAGDTTKIDYYDLIAKRSQTLSKIHGNNIIASVPVMDEITQMGNVIVRMPKTSLFLPLRRSIYKPLFILLSGFLLAILLGRLILHNISNDMENVVKEAKEITRGNLTEHFTSSVFNKCLLVTAISDMSSALQKRLSGIKDSALRVDSATQKIFDRIKKQEDHSNRFRESVQEVSTIAEHFWETSSQVEENVKEVSDQTEAAVQRILALGSKAQQIGTVNTAINDIAKRINLLSLNASIEAVQAGEHGQGFAVVAAEIRKLAESSKRSIQEISELIEDIQSATNSTLLSTEQTVDSVKRITEAMQQQGAASKQVKVAVTEMTNEMNRGLEIVNRLVENVEQLNKATDTMRSGLNQFEL